MARPSFRISIRSIADTQLFTSTTCCRSHAVGQCACVDHTRSSRSQPCSEIPARPPWSAAFCKWCAPALDVSGSEVTVFDLCTGLLDLLLADHLTAARFALIRLINEPDLDAFNRRFWPVHLPKTRRPRPQPRNSQPRSRNWLRQFPKRSGSIHPLHETSAHRKHAIGRYPVDTAGPTHTCKVMRRIFNPSKWFAIRDREHRLTVVLDHRQLTSAPDSSAF